MQRGRLKRYSDGRTAVACIASQGRGGRWGVLVVDRDLLSVNQQMAAWADE